MNLSIFIIVLVIIAVLVIFELHLIREELKDPCTNPCTHRAGDITGQFFINPPELHLTAHCAECGAPFLLGENQSPGLVVKVTLPKDTAVTQTSLINEQV